ncbi:MAG: hypothetical protein MMC33_004007 [Icmadophila ericetorum]|nr:hypothetical protein [Icmadophila ericetorum]
MASLVKDEAIASLAAGAQQPNTEASKQFAEEASFDYDPEDLWEAISHCASPINAVDILPPSDTLTLPAEVAKPIDTTLKAEAGPVVEASTSTNAADQGENVSELAAKPLESNKLKPQASSEEPDEDEESERVIQPSKIKAPPLEDPEAERMQYDDDGKPVIPPGYEVRFEIDQDDRRYITILNPSEDYSNPLLDEPDYPEADMRYQRPNFVYGRKYRYEHDEHGELIMKAPEVHLDYYNYAEHCFLGNELKLKFLNGTFEAATKELTLENDVHLTYGQINGLGGDFFGTYDPICKGETFKDQCDRFQRAYACLGKEKNRTPWELKLILDTRKEELAVIKKARDEGRSTAEAYNTLVKDGLSGLWGFKEEAELSAATVGRADWGKSAAPSYVKLAQINFDHFGEDARRAYNAGHYCAMQEAARPGGNLEIAYAMNAFADHYLGDCFAAGHMRTPRRALHATYTQTAYSVVTAPVAGIAKFGEWLTSKMGVSTKAADLLGDRSGPAIALAPDMCSKYMHDEDNALGLTVSNPAGKTWKAYGDKRLFEKDNEENCEYMRRALQASANEIFKVYKSKKVIEDTAIFAAWKHAPTLESLYRNGNHSPMWKTDNGKLLVRDRVDDRNCFAWHELGWSETFASVYTQLRRSEVMKKY